MKHQLDEITKTQKKLVEAPTKLMSMLKTSLFEAGKNDEVRLPKGKHLHPKLRPNLIKGAPIEVVKEKDGSVHVKTIPAWCAVCPYYST